MKLFQAVLISLYLPWSEGFVPLGRPLTTKVRTNLNMIGLKAGDEKNVAMKEKPLVSLREVFTPPYADGFTIGWTLVGQGLLVNLAYIASMAYNFFDKTPIGADIVSFDPDSMMTSLYIAGPIIVGGFIIDKIPGKPFEDISRDTRFYVLRLLGMQSKVLPSFLIALILSATAAFSEELFFRGIVMRAIDNFSNFPTALVASSALFGLAHFPIWGANSLVEALLGAAMGYGYWYSGYNLAVPITIHTLYDLVTIMITWVVAKDDLNRRMKLAIKREASRLDELNPQELASVSEAIFNMLDLDKDGSIDYKELDAALKLYGYGIIPLGGYDSRAIFERADTNGDGIIDLSEFTKVIREDLKGIKQWGLEST